MFENSVLRRIFVSKRVEVAGRSKNCIMRSFKILPNIIKAILLRRMR
jgi:hypothetical protein